MPPLRSITIVIISQCILLLLLSISLFETIEAKEIVATHEWQRLSEDDTIPAGLHVRMDLSTGGKWAKLATDERVKEAEIDASTGALRVVEAKDVTVKGSGADTNNIGG